MRSFPWKRRVAACWALLLPIASAAPIATFESPPARTSLIELYTSEGCSSCPPAERWLTRLSTAPGLWKRFVPVAFHVNYWDRLGWRDALSNGVFTAREYAYAAAWHAPSVYTPCFVRNGEEWHPAGGLEGAAATAGVLRVEVISRSPLRCRASFGGSDDVDLHVALLAGGLSRRIAAGENAGATLTHDFTVVALKEGRLSAQPIELPPPLIASAPHWSLAAWVTRPGSPVALQATGGAL